MEKVTDVKKKGGALKGIIGLVVIIGFLWFYFGGGDTKMAQNKMDEISNQVAQDQIKQYNIAVSGGDKMQIYTQASLVAQSFLQAKDEENYKKWKAIEKKAAEEAGIPQ
jgi:hypothetical protein